MKKFFLVYGVLMLGLFAAFSYLESQNKDERMLKARVRYTHQLMDDKQCRDAFNLLTQRKTASLKRFYEGKNLGDLKQSFCEVWKSAELKNWSMEVRRLEESDFNFRVDLQKETAQQTHSLYFTKQQGELALTRID